MGDDRYSLTRSRSAVSLVDGRRVYRSASVVPLSRTLSSDHLYATDPLRGRYLYKYRRDLELAAGEAYADDRPPVIHYPTYRRALVSRRRFEAPMLTWLPNYAYHYDRYDPLYWRRYLGDDGYFGRQLWQPQRPFSWQSWDTNRAVRMYRQGLVGFDQLDKYWLTPSYWDKRMVGRYLDKYVATGYYGPRRYFYSFYPWV